MLEISDKILERRSDDPQFVATYKLFYKNVESMMNKDPRMFETGITLVKLAMEMVEQLKDEHGQFIGGPEKAQLALDMILYILRDMADNGKIPAKVADPIIAIFLSPVGPAIIFGIAALAAKGKVLINKISTKMKDCCV